MHSTPRSHETVCVHGRSLAFDLLLGINATRQLAHKLARSNTHCWDEINNRNIRSSDISARGDQMGKHVA